MIQKPSEVLGRSKVMVLGLDISSSIISERCTVNSVRQMKHKCITFKIKQDDNFTNHKLYCTSYGNYYCRNKDASQTS